MHLEGEHCVRTLQMYRFEIEKFLFLVHDLKQRCQKKPKALVCLKYRIGIGRLAPEFMCRNQLLAVSHDLDMITYLRNC